MRRIAEHGSFAKVTYAERTQGHLRRWFYPCSREMHRTLGELYVADSQLPFQK